MKILILYKSQHGATKQYAEWLKEEILNAELFTIEEFNPAELKNYDKLIIGSCVYGGKMPALEFIVDNWQTISKINKVFYFTVGVIPPEAKFSLQMYDSIPAFIREKVQYLKLPGQITYMKPNFLQKLAFKAILKGDPDGRIDRSKIEPIVKFALES